jgi:hypothetical protein
MYEMFIKMKKRRREEDKEEYKKLGVDGESSRHA